MGTGNYSDECMRGAVPRCDKSQISRYVRGQLAFLQLSRSASLRHERLGGLLVGDQC